MVSPLPIFIISLRRSTERRRAMQDRLHAAGLEGEFFDAVDGRVLDRAASPELAGAAALSNGEVACYLSHLGVWQRVAERGLSHALVLEDDVLLEPDLLPVLQALCARPLPYDLVRLSSLHKQVGKVVAELPAARKLVLPLKNPSGTQGYLLSHDGARRLLAAYARPERAIDSAVDNYWRHGLAVVMVAPPVVAEDRQLDSGIAPSGRATAQGVRGLRARWTRSVQKHLAVAAIYRRLCGKSLWSFWTAKSLSLPVPRHE
ncbi:glycosyltransferase family 25 protein [Eleftheria terrae]|uniref:glycosyltransferase family 25 protein n=1 Tax=Eleftheria terrae TaxID=1597781 RepID=UPI00263B6F42|nr:glycosyltransferase family 25 protein [Eleftheria terrae]WKB54325.1 glycosyltransferase family 25 protein [Eleftheria terrae]